MTEPAKATRPAPAADHHKDLQDLIRGHRIYRAAAKTFARLLVVLLYRVRFEGLEHIPTQGPVLLVANHTSLMDIPAIHMRLKPWIFWVSKKELFKAPVIGSFFSAMGCIPVDRHKVDLHAARGIFGALDAGKIVAIFPQATRVPPERILEHLPRTGVAHFAIKTGAPIVPVLIDGDFRLWRRNRIVFGPSFKLETTPRQRYNHAQLMTFTIEIMQKIYDLKGFDYHLSDQALLSDHLVRQPDGTLAMQTTAQQDALKLLRKLGQ
ncbi:MAG: 1-acyl-sn-glycerol-3-phosphate acyltransferase [Clostridia bacterium]|nr:1-acyl-sn-glycerol-3-phosphate acyltransferase [Clostridia bacterium]NCC75148.1 1-acyl-sn-glycerol-3-phosphate acyltransferase [Clostridia bacterium]